MTVAESAKRKGRLIARDWTRGSIIGNLWSLSWPMMITNGLNMAGPTVDMIWVGRLGSAAVAGVGVAGMVSMAADSMKMGLTVGVRAMVARFVGAGDREQANHVAQQGLIISVAFAFLLAMIGIFLSEPIMSIMGVEAGVVAQGAPYLRIMFVSSLFMSLRTMNEAIMQSSGDSVTPMWITIFFRIFHIALCPFLVFGWWIFPKWGVIGAAATNVIAQSLGMYLGIWILLTGRTRLRLTLRNFRFDPAIIWRIVKIGVPASLTGMERSFAQLVMTRFMADFGTVAVASHSIVQRIDNFIQMPGMGLGNAAGVLAGQNLGAGQPGRAEKSGWLAAGLFSGLMLVCSLAIWQWAEGAIRIFNNEPELLKVAGTFLRIEIVSYLIFGLAMVLMQCLNGIGDTIPTLVVTLVTMWGIQVPLAYFLPRITPLSMYGVRWGIVAGMVLRGITYAIYFRTGKWKLKKV